MLRTHGFSGNRLTRELRAGATALAAASIFALAIQPTHGGAEDWFDARAEAILDAYIKADCENYCLTDRDCYKRCFDARYEEVLYEFDAASWAERDAALDNLAKTYKPNLVSPRAKEAERRAKAQGECRRAAYQANEAADTACYDARRRAHQTEDTPGSWSANNRALGDCTSAARQAYSEALRRCDAIQ